MSNDAIQVKSLNYAHGGQEKLALSSINMKVPKGSRLLLVGANGAGKSTLLRLLAGKSLAPNETIKIDNKDPFRENMNEITYLGTEWANNPVVRGDIKVSHLLASIGADNYPDRRDQLLSILDVDLTWRMNRVSDGERRRVQLTMGLMKPWSMLLLDEVTVDLDVLARSDLLEFLKQETMSRACTIVYATHIFDGLASWPTHLVHMSLGRVLSVGPPSEYLGQASPASGNSALLELCLKWLTEDKQERGRRGDEKRLTWSDVPEDEKAGNVGKDVFTNYFKITRGR